MSRVLALGLALLVAAGCSGSPTGSGQGGPGLEVKSRYLVVDVVGPAGWVKEHSFSVQWQGKAMPLPVAFHVSGPAESFEMGSGGEPFGHLTIGTDRVPIAVTPDTKFQVRNTGVVAVVSEKGSQKDLAAMSLVTSVALSPPEHPGEIRADAEQGPVESSGKRLEKRLNELVASGRVIEVAPGK
jgi:hypothetical protein